MQNGTTLQIEDRTAALPPNTAVRTQHFSAAAILPRLKSEIAARHQTHEGGGWTGGLRCALSVVDKDLRGFRPAAITVLSAPPHVGKSTLANQIAYQVAAFAGQRAATLYVSYEDDPEYLLLKQVSRLSGWRINDLLDGVVAPDDEELQQAMVQLASVPLHYLRGRRETDPATIIERAAQVKQETGAENLLLVLDYLQFFARFAPGNNRVEQVGNAISQVRRITDETGAVVLAIGSQNREANKSGDTNMFGGMWSSDIEYDADILFTLAPPTEKQLETATSVMRNGKSIVYGKEHRTLKVEKARYGGTDSKMLLTFDNNYGKFKDVLDDRQ